MSQCGMEMEEEMRGPNGGMDATGSQGRDALATQVQAGSEGGSSAKWMP